MENTTFYLTASSKQQGALGIFHAYGEEMLLARFLDAHVGGKTNPEPANKLTVHELRYGWLRGTDGETIDEVMLACPAAGQRVLMTHGGKVIREHVESYLQQNGFVDITNHPDQTAAMGDALIDALLSACVTEGQAAAVLEARECGDASGLERVFAQRRVVLAGAPNAGKSSLLNALSGYDRAFVDAEAGATRDVVDELVDLAGYPVWLGDMPGYMGAESGLEKDAWRKAEQRLRLAESVWFVVDGSEEWGASAEAAASAIAAILDREGGRPVLVVVNKADRPLRLTGEPWRQHFPGASVVFVSSLPEGNAVGTLETYVSEAWETL